MADTKREKDSSKRGITFMDLLKVVGALAIFIPVMTVIFQYRQSVQQDLDKSFRSVVENLSSDRERRLAAASSIGTFMNKGEKYYDESVNILINRLSIELDYTVLNAIRGSLEKIEEEEYKKVIHKLLAIERSIFIQKFALENWRDSAKKAFEDSEKRYSEREALFKKYKSDVGREMLDNLKKEMNLNWKTYSNREKDFNELSMHKQVVSDFLSIFLRITRSVPIERLEFFQNSMDYVNMIELNLTNSDFKRSGFCFSNILDVKFDRSTIIHTGFSFSDLTNSSFANCKIDSSLFTQAVVKKVDFSGADFRDVFFAGSDLTGTKFNTTKGLKPIYFYKAENIDKAIFDPEFKKELDEKLVNITEDKFKEYVSNKSELIDIRRRELFETLDVLKNMNNK